MPIFERRKRSMEANRLDAFVLLHELRMNIRVASDAIAKGAAAAAPGLVPVVDQVVAQRLAALLEELGPVAPAFLGVVAPFLVESLKEAHLQAIVVLATT